MPFRESAYLSASSCFRFCSTFSWISGWTNFNWFRNTVLYVVSKIVLYVVSNIVLYVETAVKNEQIKCTNQSLPPGVGCSKLLTHFVRFRFSICFSYVWVWSHMRSKVCTSWLVPWGKDTSIRQRNLLCSVCICWKTTITEIHLQIILILVLK